MPNLKLKTFLVGSKKKKKNKKKKTNNRSLFKIYCKKLWT